MAEKTLKRPFVVALPIELDKAVGNVQNYSEINKLGTTMATSSEGAISNYLHRQGFEKVRVMQEKLRIMSGSQGVGMYACDFSNIETREVDKISDKGRKITTRPEDRRLFEEFSIAKFLANRRGGNAEDRLGQAGEILNNLDKSREK